MAKRSDPMAALAVLEGRYADLARSPGRIGFIASGGLTRRVRGRANRTRGGQRLQTAIASIRAWSTVLDGEQRKG